MLCYSRLGLENGVLGVESTQVILKKEKKKIKNENKGKQNDNDQS